MSRGASFESEREILVLVGLPDFVVFRFDARDPGERLVQVCRVRAGASDEPRSAWHGRGFESVLYDVDAPDEFCGVRRGEVVPGILRTLGFARPCDDDQLAAGTFSSSLDMSR